MQNEHVIMNYNPDPPPPPPPPPLECIGDPHDCSNFLGKGGIYWAKSWEYFPRKPGEIVCFFSLFLEIGGGGGSGDGEHSL